MRSSHCASGALSITDRVFCFFPSPQVTVQADQGVHVPYLQPKSKIQ